jgi:hypothetical protein
MTMQTRLWCGHRGPGVVVKLPGLHAELCDGCARVVVMQVTKQLALEAEGPAAEPEEVP